MTTTIELKKLARARKISKYYRMTKPQLLGALGMKDELRAHQRGKQVNHALKTQVASLGKGDEQLSTETKKALIKGRITRSIKRGLVAEEKKQGRKLTQEEKRVVAARALAVEVKAIRSHLPEVKPKRGNGQKMKPKETAKRGIAPFKRKPKPAKELTPEQQKQVASDVRRIKEGDRHGQIGDAVDKGDERILRSKARDRMLNHPRTMFDNFKTHEDAVVAAFKSKEPQPSEHSVKVASLEGKISENRRKAAEGKPAKKLRIKRNNETVTQDKPEVKAIETPTDVRAISVGKYYQTKVGALKLENVDNDKEWRVKVVTADGKTIKNMVGGDDMTLLNGQSTIHQLSHQFDEMKSAMADIPVENVEKRKVAEKFLAQFD